ncbi:MAG: carbohydrate-binding protein, partial [Prolixibacteraceae bacterium]|nr:carbohydrate-binding protein [Prolixibacteraceae bacterium]
LEQAEMMKLENCIIHFDVIDALFRQAQGDKSPKPFKENDLPGILFAADYDLGANGYAYFDTDTANYRVSTQNHTGWNNGRSYRNDGVDIEQCTDAISNGFNVGWTENGEWLNYTVNAQETGTYTVVLRYKLEGSVSLQVDGENFEALILPFTDEWANADMGEIALESGIHQVKLKIVEGGIKLNYLEFKQ